MIKTNISFKAKSIGNLAFFFLMLGVLSPIGANSFEKGSELFLFNRPKEAAIFLEQAIVEDQSNYKAYLYLAICYEQNGQAAKALDVYQKALGRGLGELHVLYFNMANNYVRLNRNAEAKDAYQKSVQSKADHVSAYLNLGNLELRSNSLDSALSSYTSFVTIAPNDPLTPDVLKMIAMIKGEQERRIDEERLVAEQKVREEQRVAAEKVERERLAAARLLEEQRQRKLMEDILNGLTLSNSNDSNTLSAGTEDAKNTNDNLERE